jgi:hypothetical protein
VLRDRADRVKGDDLPIGGDPAQLAGERGHVALAWSVAGDERDARDGRSDSDCEMQNGPSFDGPFERSL